jgi:hypothetical protein
MSFRGAVHDFLQHADYEEFGEVVFEEREGRAVADTLAAAGDDGHFAFLRRDVLVDVDICAHLWRRSGRCRPYSPRWCS